MHSKSSDTPKKTLICVELPTQVNIAINHIFETKLSNYVLLALTPHVEYELEKRRVAFKRPEDYYSENDLNQLGHENLDSLQLFIDLVDQKLQNEFHGLDQYGIRPANLSWYNLKILFNSVSVRAFILARIIAFEQPYSVSYFTTNPETIRPNLYFNHESAWSRVIHSACISMNISNTSIGKDTDPTELSNPIMTLRYKRYSSRNLFYKVAPKICVSTFKEITYGARLMYFLLRPSSKTGSNILMLEKAYSAKLLMQNNDAKTKFKFLYWNFHNKNIFLNMLLKINKHYKYHVLSQTTKQSFQERSKHIYDKCKSDPEISPLLTFSGIDCTDTLDTRLTTFFTDIVARITDTYVKARYLINLIRPEAIIASTMGSNIHQTVSLISSQSQSQFIVYRHGDSAGHVMMESITHPVIDRLEMQSSDYVLAFGHGDVMYLSGDNTSTAKVIPVGSAVLDNIHATNTKNSSSEIAKKYGLDSSKKTVIYVPTTMDGNIRIIPYRSQSPSRRFSIEREIIEVFANHPQVQFIVKFPLLPEYPFSATARLIKDLNIENCFIITDPFLDLIPIADMFVTDYTSTNFIEMLTTDKPILVCGQDFPLPWNPDKWHPSILQMWRERVEYYDDLPEFKENLDKKLLSMEFNSISSDDTLLKLFGTHKNDGCSLERAISALDNICSNRYTG